MRSGAGSLENCIILYGWAIEVESQTICDKAL